MPLNDFIHRIVDNGISVFADSLLFDYPSIHTHILELVLVKNG